MKHIGILKIGIPLTVEKTVRAIEVFVLLPLMIRVWGVEVVGAWLLVSSVPTIIGLSEMGIGSSGANSFALGYFTGDRTRAWQLMRTSISALGILAFAISGAALILVVWPHNWSSIVPQFSLFGSGNWGLVFSLLMVSRTIWFFADPVDAMWRVIDRAAESRWVISTALAGKLLIWAYLLWWASAEPWLLAVAELCWLVVIVGLYLAIGWRFHRNDLERQGMWFSSKELRYLARVGVGYLMNPLWQALHFQGMLWVVKALLGVEAVAVFGVTRSVARAITQASIVLGGMHFPRLQACIGRGAQAEARGIYIKLVKLSVLMSIVILVAVGTGRELMFNRLLNGQASVSTATWWTLVGAAAISGVWWCGSIIVKSFNRPWALSLPGTILAGASLLLGYLGGLHWGLPGVAIGCIAFELAMLVLVLALAQRWLGLSTSPTILA